MTINSVGILGVDFGLFCKQPSLILPYVYFLYQITKQSYGNLPLQDLTPCHEDHQTLNGHIKKGSDSLIRLIGGPTAKWLQIGAVLMFLSHTPSLMSSKNSIHINYGSHSEFAFQIISLRLYLQLLFF